MNEKKLNLEESRSGLLSREGGTPIKSGWGGGGGGGAGLASPNPDRI